MVVVVVVCCDVEGKIDPIIVVDDDGTVVREEGYDTFGKMYGSPGICCCVKGCIIVDG